ncbi:MAG: 30S ribosome-binding factor RbfA [Pirellulaceae bacterium]|nr:30S ribosome-binding factor RbfA [Pirellulaceae bacterium]
MSSRRVLKVAEAIREVVSMAILTELQDPRIANVTVTYVEAAADLRQAKVYVSVRGDETQQRLCLHGLQHAAGYLQQKISQRVDTRYTPKIQFELDMGVKRSVEMGQLLNQLAQERAERESQQTDSAASSDVQPSDVEDVNQDP